LKGTAALAAALLSLHLSTLALAHEGHHHTHGEVVNKAAPPGSEREKRLQQINQSYLATIKPIFQAKCFDCHSEATRFPWYYSIPGVKQYIDSDIREAKEHLEMTHDFPFRGHGTSEEDLEAIGASMVKGDMPPWSYRIFHSGSKVTDEEASKILSWAKESRGLLFWDKKD
jgi:hypothetical protein